jgi:DNA-binding phage protein
MQQQQFRYRIVANSRFLILPGVKVPHLASHALAVRRLRGDLLRRFGYEPILVETFVAPPWRGTCYRAANWVYPGQTTGRGRQDRQYTRAGVIRQVFVYPLLRDWRRALVAPISPPAQEQKRAPDKDRTQKRENADRPQELAPQGGSIEMSTAEQALNEMTADRIRRRFAALVPFLDEKQRRLLAGAEALTYGVGGLEQVSALVGMARETVRRGMQELQNPTRIESERVRRRGGGRKPTTASDPDLRTHLEELVSPDTRGDPQSPLRWTGKSTRKLAAQTRPGSTSAPITIPPPLRWPAFAAGGRAWAEQPTPMPGIYLSLPTGAEATVRVPGSGRRSYKNYLTKPDCQSLSVTFRRAPASGTRSSIDSSHTSCKTGMAAPWKVMR